MIYTCGFPFPFLKKLIVAVSKGTYFTHLAVLTFGKIYTCKEKNFNHLNTDHQGWIFEHFFKNKYKNIFKNFDDNVFHNYKWILH